MYAILRNFACIYATNLKKTRKDNRKAFIFSHIAISGCCDFVAQNRNKIATKNLPFWENSC